MRNQTDTPPARQWGARGCVTLAAVFLVVSVAGALLTLMLYALVVQEWGLVAVPREHGYEMILYAPLSGLVCGFAAAFWSSRAGPLARRTRLLLGLGLVVAVALLLVFFGSGAVL